MSLLTLAYLLLPAVGALLANQATDVRTARRVGAGFLAAATLIASTAPVSLLLAADDPLDRLLLDDAAWGKPKRQRGRRALPRGPP